MSLTYQWDIKNCNILCFAESWLNYNTYNIQLDGASAEQTSGKTRGGGLCLFINHSWCTMSNIKVVSRYCSPEVEYLMISCRPHYLTREFSSILFVTIYLPPQTDAVTKTALNHLYKATQPPVSGHSTTCIRPLNQLCKATQPAV